ncbi:MAG: ankyrin repeat domain-containing protein [Legionella sp.]|uniref:Dot/Icm T4SS effector AnkK/LegA5 n=1 Tax=Legionella sp. TaxID=459 RepID=UPI002851F450|nr:ankyrin repeat domain-containing protein [Legionella sp.]
MGAAFYNIKDIILGLPSHSGHEAYLGALYKRDNQKIVYKKNKYGIASFSRLEVSFSQLAKLFLSPDLTPSQRLVVDDEHQVVGVAVQHLCYAVENKEGLEHAFYTLNNPRSNCKTTKHRISDLAKIPIYFLDKLPQGFYAQLLKAEKAEQLTIDYDSLASILVTSYTMEEDDLHKGNFGFYLVEKAGKPQVVFFKIDHDLMFVDSIMGFHTRRPFHLFHGPSAFDIFAEDLISFPNLKRSANSYWPTKFGYVANPFDNKEYHNFAEIAAFSRLATTPAFIRSKWKTFFKHCSIPRTLIETTLRECANIQDPADRAHIALITQAMVTRLAHLRAVLFSIKEFRDFVVSLSDEENEELLREIIPTNDALEPQITQTLARFHTLCAENGFAEGDTPLHTAIKMGEYRYEESIRMFGQFINVKNKEGKTPLDVALDQVNAFAPDVDNNVGVDMRFVMRHLLENGAQKTEAFKRTGLDSEIETYVFVNPFKASIVATSSYADLQQTLRDIGEAHQFCLKYKKNMAIDCIRQWTDARKSHPDFQQELEQLNMDVNGQSSEAEAAPLKYLRQLRSRLWIVRQLRGLYGLTSTQMEINQIIHQAKHELNPQGTSYFSFFSGGKTQAAPQHGATNLPSSSMGLHFP